MDGVSDITYLGQRDYSIRAWLDPQKLAALQHDRRRRGRTRSAARTWQRPPGRSASRRPPAGQPFQLPLDTLGRLTEPEQFGDIIVKVGRAASV